MPGAYAPLPPMSLMRPLRPPKPLSAAKNGTWVVPACVTSGPPPETAALRMRSNWTSQPTSSTLTLTPVWRSNACTMRCVSWTGCGPLFMTHRRMVEPFCSAAGLAAGLLLELLSSLLPPQAATTRAIAAAAIHAGAAIFLRTILPLLRKRFWSSPPRVIDGLHDHLLSASGGRRRGGCAHDELDRKRHRLRDRGVRRDEPRERAPGLRPKARLVLAQRCQRRLDVACELDVVEADDRHVARHLEASLRDGADRAERHEVRGAHDGGRRLVEVEQATHRLLARFDVEISIGDVLVA